MFCCGVRFGVSNFLTDTSSVASNPPSLQPPAGASRTAHPVVTSKPASDQALVLSTSADGRRDVLFRLNQFNMVNFMIEET